MIHVDVTKFANIVDGGGERHLCQQQGLENRRDTRTAPRRLPATYRHPVPAHCHRRPLSRRDAEICAVERADTATAVLRRAVARSADHGVTVERVLSDSGACYCSLALRNTCDELSITRNERRSTDPRPTARSVKTWVGAALDRSDPGQGMTTVSCVRFVDRLRCSVVVRTGQAELT